ncbi:hypothetical protein J4403_01425 [Candidatus Woesearchaeota archaeon]|nr:hypothetical protein [Candidatus Woesearchaeota archaeon]
MCEESNYNLMKGSVIVGALDGNNLTGNTQQVYDFNPDGESDSLYARACAHAGIPWPGAPKLIRESSDLVKIVEAGSRELGLAKQVNEEVLVDS